jgi:O-antigen/teichoic acid export membrane protein
MLYGAVIAVGATHSSVGRPGLGLWITFPALVLNTVLNLLLVPLLGTLGSATATAVVFGASTLLAVIVVNRILRIGINLKRLATLFALGLGFYAATAIAAPYLGRLTTSLAAIAIYLATLGVTGILNRTDRSRFMDILRIR